MSGDERRSVRLPAPLRSEPDEFGIPDVVFGRHPEAFWGGLGRTVALAAVLEDQLIQLLMTLTNAVDDPKIASLPGTKAIARLHLLPLDTDRWAGFEDYLGRAADALAWRHTLAHGLWPAQADPDYLFVHRRLRDGARQLTPTSVTEIRERIAPLVKLVTEWPRWYGLAQQHVTST
ncbi:MAG: hypothetical protein AAGC63_16105 [Propionicimonas sp.]